MAAKDDDVQKGDGEDKARQAGEDDLPEDVEALKKLLRDERRKSGQMANDRAKERTARQALTERAKAWLDLEEAGHSPDEIKTILDQRSEAEVAKARETGNIDKLIQNARAQAEKQAAEEKARREKAEGLVQRVMVDDVVKRLLDRYIEPEFKTAVFALLRPKFTAAEDPDDEYGLRPVVSIGGEDMPAEEWIRQWAETDSDALPFLKRSLAAGGGAGGSGGRIKTQFYRSEMSAGEKSRFIRQHPGGASQGLIEYNKLPWAREKKAS